MTDLDSPKPVRGFFLCGTDTGVGKTEVGRAILLRWAALGLRPRALKPVETGVLDDRPLDALALREACGEPGNSLPIDEVCPYRFKLPAAPLVAAEAQGASVDLHKLLEHVARARRQGPVLVEAAGGLQVPLAREPATHALLTNLDLAARVGLPAVLVARAGLGTINHSVLSVRALRDRAVDVVAVVLNRTQPGGDPSQESNARMIAELARVQVLGPGPFEPDPAKRPAALLELVSGL
jgi:dethiobiotin synthetase